MLTAILISVLLSAAAAESIPLDATQPLDRGGGEIRMAVLEANVPIELVSERLVRRDSAGVLLPGLAERWTIADSGMTWTFFLRAGLKCADGSPLLPAQIATALGTSSMRRIVATPMKSIRSETAAIIIRLKAPDPAFGRRLANPAAGIVVPRRAGTGTFSVLRRDSAAITLIRNPHAAVPALCDTLTLLIERDPARAVYLVEAGLCDIAPVCDDELGRLVAEQSSNFTLVPGATRDVHLLASSGRGVPLTRTHLRMLCGLVNRALIVRTFFSGRGFAFEHRAPTPRQIAALPSAIRIAAERSLPQHARLIPRIVYDLRRAGLNAQQSNTIADCHYLVRPEVDLPAAAEPLYAVTPYWIVSNRIRGFITPSFGDAGILRAERVR